MSSSSLWASNFQIFSSNCLLLPDNNAEVAQQENKQQQHELSPRYTRSAPFLPAQPSRLGSSYFKILISSRGRHGTCDTAGMLGGAGDFVVSVEASRRITCKYFIARNFVLSSLLCSPRWCAYASLRHQADRTAALR